MHKKQKVLITWEFGSNLGHIMAIVSLAERLMQRNHHVVLALKQPHKARELLTKNPRSAAQLQIVNAPIINPKALLNTPAYTQPQILYRRGYHSTAAIAQATNQWIDLFKQISPDTYIFDYSPTALLASYLIKMNADKQRIIMSSGFGDPPPTATLNDLCFGIKELDEHTRITDHIVAQTITQIAQSRGHPGFSSLNQLYALNHHFLLTVKEFDFYSRNQTPHTYIGPIGQSTQGTEVTWPNISGHKIFAYLRPEAASFEAVITAFAQTDASFCLYAPNAKSLEKRFGNIHLIDQPANLAQALTECRCIIHHGGIGTLHQGLSAGVPSLLVPSQFEQFVISQKLLDNKLGLRVDFKSDVETIKTSIHNLCHSELYQKNAIAYASRHNSVDQKNALDAVCDFIDDPL